MTSLQRIANILIGFVMISMAILMLFEPRTGFRIICDLICATLFLSGLRLIIFYIRMARYMVEGVTALFEGILLLDVSMFGFMLNDFPTSYLIIYLLAIHAFSGGVDVLNAFQAKKLYTPWIGKMLHGMMGLIIAVFCVFYGFIKKDTDMLVYIYAAGLVYSAVVRMVRAFRRTAIVYIP